MRIFRLLLTFYRSFVFASSAITIASIILIAGFGEKGIHMIQTLFWFKIASLGIIVLVINETRKKEFFYYRNLGLSRLSLWLPVLFFDLLAFIISIVSLAAYIYEASAGSG